MKTEIINIARQFAKYPAGRYAKDGPFSGEAFRDKLLFPALCKEDTRIVVQLDGTRGLASSFLEEAFGGLIRRGLTPSILHERLEIRSSDPSLIAEVEEYIAEQAVSVH